MKEIGSHRLKFETGKRLVGVVAFVAVYAGMTATVYRQFAGGDVTNVPSVTVVRGEAPAARNVDVKDGMFYADGEPLVVRAVGWDPVRPGELPWERAFRRDELADDLARIKAAGFNTVRTWAALSPEELALVAEHDLRVLQGVWVEPDGDFADPGFRREALGRVARSVEASRWSPAILGYLIMNEPRAQAVARAGLSETRAFLRELGATVRGIDPSALIGYASWPGMEALDDDLLDFVGFNIYPHRPRVVMDEFGLEGYVGMLDRTVARGRPLIITEYGISVSPGNIETPGRGGASEDEQAQGLVRLSSAFYRAGARGTTVFQWGDGWWKGDAADPHEHDPDEPEQWFGLVAYQDVSDRRGTARAALAAMAGYHRAILIEPRDGQVHDLEAPVRIFADQPVTARVSVNGAAPEPLSLSREGRRWHKGKLALPGGGIRADIEIELFGEDGELIRSERRLLRTAPPRDATLAFGDQTLTARPAQAFSVKVFVSGADAGSSSISVATFTEDRFNEDRVSVAVDDDGRARVEFEAPEQHTLLTLLAFEDDPDLPPAERAAAWAVVEVRD